MQSVDQTLQDYSSKPVLASVGVQLYGCRVAWPARGCTNQILYFAANTVRSTSKKALQCADLGKKVPARA